MSHEVLLELLGPEADPARHRRGVDVAFALTPTDPGERLPARLRAVLTSGDGPLVGVNVSGLLADDGTAAARFGLTLDYRVLNAQLVRRLVEAGVRVLLVPHVRDRDGAGESDLTAATDVLAALPPSLAARVHVVPDDLDARQVKWVISQCDWFCGARMHATIAALSSGVPSAAVAYTMKFRGVFATCGAEDQVVEARTTRTEEALEQLMDSFEHRQATRRLLATTHLEVAGRARLQIAEALAADKLAV